MMVDFFCYGTLKRGFKAHSILELHNAVFVKKAKTASRYQLYQINWFPGMVIDDLQEGGVQGEVFSVTDECIERLDQYEGAPDLFKRHNIELEDGTYAVAYLFNEDVSDKKKIEDGEWIYGKKENKENG